MAGRTGSSPPHEPLREDQDCETGQLIKEMGEDELQTSIDNHTKVQETQDQQLEMRLAGPQVPLIETGVYSQRPKSKARGAVVRRRAERANRPQQQQQSFCSRILLAWSVFFCICCNPILGRKAIRLSKMAQDANLRGDNAEAKDRTRRAVIYIVVSFGVTAVLGVIGTAVTVIVRTLFRF